MLEIIDIKQQQQKDSGATTSSQTYSVVIVSAEKCGLKAQSNPRLQVSQEFSLLLYSIDQLVSGWTLR